MVKWETLKYKINNIELEFLIGNGKATEVISNLGNKKL